MDELSNSMNEKASCNSSDVAEKEKTTCCSTSSNSVNVSGSSENNSEPVSKESILLLLGALALGLIFNILFYKQTLGVSYPIFVIAFYCFLIWRLKERLVFKLDLGWLLSVPVLMLSLTYFLFSNEIFMVLNFVAVPILIIVQTLLITGNNRYQWYTAKFTNDIFYGIFVRTLSHIFKPFEIISKLIRKKADPGKYAVLGKVFMGLMLSIPLVFIIVLLLSSADEVFKHMMGNIPQFLTNINIGDFIVQAIVMLMVSVVIYSYLWSLAKRENVNIGSKVTGSGSKKLVWDPIIVITVFTMINIIYVVFAIIQFAYLFSSANSVLPSYVTYAEYARRGFFELILVTVINLGILLLSINLTKKEGRNIEIALRILNSLLIVCTLVMLASAHLRMSLYEEMYGYTYLRVLTHAFMVFIFVLLAATLVKVWYEKMSLLKWYIVISITSYLVVNYVNIDAIIAKNNIKRYKTEQKIDTYYLRSLSYDAIPYAVNLMNDQDKEVARSIENYLYDVKEKLKHETSWQSFNISEFRAKNILSNYDLSYESR